MKLTIWLGGTRARRLPDCGPSEDGPSKRPNALLLRVSILGKF
jgi:hypothetical protein